MGKRSVIRAPHQPDSALHSRPGRPQNEGPDYHVELALPGIAELPLRGASIHRDK